MESNEGWLDRVLRMSLGLGMLISMAAGTIGLWGLIGLVPLATGAIGWCPLYSMFGIRTVQP